MVAVDGRAARSSVARELPDLVLTDVMMPRLDGFGLLAAIRADERTRTLPVILLSARAGEEARIEGLAAGADDYLVKPFSARELLARVGSQLELARQRREAEARCATAASSSRRCWTAAPIGVYLVDRRLPHPRRSTRSRCRRSAMFPAASMGRDFDEIMHLLLGTAVRRRGRARSSGTRWRPASRTCSTSAPSVASDRGVTEYYEWRLDRITLPDGRYGLVCYFRDISAQVAAQQGARGEPRGAARRPTAARTSSSPRSPTSCATRSRRFATRCRSCGWRGARRRASRAACTTMMERQVDHMVRLVDDLLEVSRITRGKIELRKQRVELAAVVRSAVETSGR